MTEERGQKNSRKVAHSLLMGSDVLIDTCCDICSEDGKQVEAKGFCVDCSDNLCRECCKAHRRTKMSRNHQLKAKVSTPRQKPSSLTIASAKSNTDVCTEPCEHHPERIAVYYCTDHGLMGCSACVKANHRTCAGVDYIPDLTQGLLKSGEYKQFEKHLAELRARSVQVIKDSNVNVTKSESCSSKAVQKILDLQKDMDKCFDSLVDDVRKQSEMMKLNDTERMITIAEAGNKVLKDTEGIASNVEVLKRTHQLCKLFTYMKKTRDELTRLDQTLDDTESRNTVTDYFFEPNADIQGTIDGLVSMGQIRIRSSAAVAAPPITKDPQNVRVEHVKDVDVKTNTDVPNCWISGIAALPGNKLIIADYRNDKVKLLDLGASAVTSELKKKTGPWDIAVVTGTEVAVTLPGSNTIVFVKIARDLKEERSMKVVGECKGIAYCSEKLIVTFVSPTNFIAVLNLNGTLEKKISVDNVRRLNHIAYKYDPGSQNIYLSDYAWESSGPVTCITSAGTEKFAYKSEELRGPRGIAVDQLGRILVCGDYSGNIILLNSDLSEAKVLVDGLNKPVGLSYCQQTNKLYVGFDKEKFVRVYQLS